MATESQEPIELTGLFNWSINWLDANKEWVFSGIGVVVLTALVSFLGRLIWQKIHPSQAETSTSAPANSTKPNRGNIYLKLKAEEWNTLRLQALDPNAADTRARPLSLEQVYVDLYTTTPRPKALYLKNKEDYEQPSLFAIEALCHADQHRMVLLGQPGSGMLGAGHLPHPQLPAGYRLALGMVCGARIGSLRRRTDQDLYRGLVSGIEPPRFRRRGRSSRPVAMGRTVSGARRDGKCEISKAGQRLMPGMIRSGL